MSGISMVLHVDRDEHIDLLNRELEKCSQRCHEIERILELIRLSPGLRFKVLC